MTDQAAFPRRLVFALSSVVSPFGLASAWACRLGSAPFAPVSLTAPGPCLGQGVQPVSLRVTAPLASWQLFALPPPATWG